MRRTRERPGGTSERSMYVQLRLEWWFAISARSAAPHPTWSSAIACFRVRGSVEACDTAKAQPVALPHEGLRVACRNRSAAGCRSRNGSGREVEGRGVGGRGGRARVYCRRWRLGGVAVVVLAGTVIVDSRRAQDVRSGVVGIAMS
eukprot:6187302-Pleurochrysis_carterae.AAC.2